MLVVLALFAMSIPAMALDIGDPAPAISPGKWVTGTEADPAKPDGKTIYLVEVWSTTCPPCVRSIPILNDIQKRYADKGLKIVSFTTDTEDEVKPFLEKTPIEYSSFVDSDATTAVSYMTADNRNTIPHAFLFDKDGFLVWEGNPLDNVEGKIKSILDGKLNVAKAKEVKTLRDELQGKFSSQDVVGVLDSLAKLESLEPDNQEYYQVHFSILSQTGRHDAIPDLLNAWYKGCENDADALTLLAMVALDQGHPSSRNPALALAAAKRAVALGDGKNSSAGIALAETYKAIGRLDLALKTLDEMETTANMQDVGVIDAVRKFYNKLQEVGKNPDAEYKP